MSASFTDVMAQVAMESAAEMANKLGMSKEEDMTKLRSGQAAMMVTPSGIVVGKIRAVHTESSSARFDTYLLSDTVLSDTKQSEVILCQYRFSTNGEGGYLRQASIICSLPLGAVLYVR